MIAHLVACTAVALVAIAASVLLRGQRAAWRHAILFLALIRFAVPTEWLSTAGRRAVQVAPAARMGVAAEWLLRGPWQQTDRKPVDIVREPRYKDIWIAGIGLVLAAWSLRACRRIPAVRETSEYETAVFARAANGAAAGLRIVARDLTPGAWGLLRPVVLLPDGLSAALSETELEAVLAHELAHARRYDNLLAAIAHGVVAVFWFHPLVWWMERRMLAERETACDELVLESGWQARDYATGILKVCRMA
jgi:beta-lactamase regulating signal transducer with metallopeptidase domain